MSVHEEALLRDLARAVRDVTDENGIRRVVRVRVWIGALSHLTEAVLRERWLDVVAGTAAEGAALDITVSDDLDDPRAQGVVLVAVDVPSDEPRRSLGAGAAPPPSPRGEAGR
jgi:hydrogenase nickel incorporation protein HypA/HybF